MPGRWSRCQRRTRCCFVCGCRRTCDTRYLDGAGAGVRLAVSGHAAGENTMSTQRKFRESLDLKRMSAEMAQFKRDNRYLRSIMERMREEHPDCWVAVYGEEVVGVGANLEEMISTLGAEGIPTAHVALKYVSKEPQRLIL